MLTDQIPQPSGAAERSNRTGRLEDKVESMQTKDAVTDVNMKRLMDFANETENAIRGKNGTTGMLGRLESVESTVSDIKRLMWIVIGLLAAIGVSTAYEIITYVIRARP